jgi:cell division septum initiation protein DivIVA
MTIEDRLRWVADERDQLEKENYHLRQEIERLRAELAAWKDATIKTSEKLGRATRPADQPKAAPPPKDKFRMGPDGRCINCEQLWSNHYGKGDDCWQTASDQQSAALVSGFSVHYANDPHCPLHDTGQDCPVCGPLAADKPSAKGQD